MWLFAISYLTALYSNLFDFLQWNKKEDILKNAWNQTILVNIDLYFKSMTMFLKIASILHRRSHTDLKRREGE